MSSTRLQERTNAIRPASGRSLRDGRAIPTPVKVGRSNGLEAEVLEGLAPGDQVVLHPSDRVTPGVRIVGRE